MDSHGSIGGALAFQMVVFISYSDIRIRDDFVSGAVHMFILERYDLLIGRVMFVEYLIDQGNQ